MSIVAYIALHYGLEYLEYAIRSVIDEVDRVVVLYSETGSHGHHTAIPCPEREKDLYRAAVRGAGLKLTWHKASWPYEGAQRETIHALAPDADVVVALDADEVWAPGLLSEVIAQTEGQGARCVRVPMIHYWRSMHRAILHDPAYPIRVIWAKLPRDGSEITAGSKPISHMGYAQSPRIVRYKLQTHGHKSEFRTDCDWFTDRYMNPNATTDLHPVGSDYWHWEHVNPLDYMPAFMAEHPCFGMEVIE